jgi:hypothetical protein
MDMSFAAHGYRMFEGVLHAECAALAAEAHRAAHGSMGTRRFLEHAWCAALSARLRSSRVMQGIVPADFVAVQCTYFEKSTARNWLVPIHQDVSIPVAERIETPGFTGWSRKEGEHFVNAPLQFLQQLVAVRVHLDACSPADGPLHVVPGSHRLGILAPNGVEEARARLGLHACTAREGDVLVMRPLLLHASSKAAGASLRRVLHFVFGPPQLPGGLRWQHAV